MDTLVTRLELHDYVDTASDEEVEFLYLLIKNTNDNPYIWWKDEGFIAELERRSAALESGEDPGVPWEEVKEHLMNRLKRNDV